MQMKISSLGTWIVPLIKAAAFGCEKNVLTRVVLEVWVAKRLWSEPCNSHWLSNSRARYSRPSPSFPSQYSTEQPRLHLSITAVLIYFPVSLSACMVGACSLKVYIFMGACSLKVYIFSPLLEAFMKQGEYSALGIQAAASHKVRMY